MRTGFQVAVLLAVATSSHAWGQESDSDRPDAAPEATTSAGFAVGDRFHRMTEHTLRTTIDTGGGKSLDVLYTASVDEIVRVDRVDAKGLPVRMAVNRPRAELSVKQAALPQPQIVPHRLHGTGIGYRLETDGWRGRAEAGLTLPGLAQALSSPRGDPLRRIPAPTSEVAVGERLTIANEALLFVLRDLHSVGLADVVRVRSSNLAIVAGDREGDGESTVAHLRGTVDCVVSIVAPGAGEIADFGLELDVDCVLDPADRVPRLLVLQGSATVKSAGGKSVQIEVETRDTTLRRAADWALDRTDGFWRPPGRILPVFDDREWYVAHHVMPRRAGHAYMTEWILEGEELTKGTEAGWSEMITTRRYPSAREAPSLMRFYATIRAEVVAAAPGATWKVLSESGDTLLYEWTLKGDPRFATQHELGRLVRRDDAILQLRYTQKTEKLSAADRKAWLARLAEAAVVDTGEDEE